MANIKSDYGIGGEHLNPKDGTATRPALATVLRDMADDLETIRANGVTLHAKLDADAGVTDTDYGTALDIAPGGILTKKV